MEGGGETTNVGIWDMTGACGCARALQGRRGERKEAEGHGDRDRDGGGVGWNSFVLTLF